MNTVEISALAKQVEKMSNEIEAARTREKAAGAALLEAVFREVEPLAIKAAGTRPITHYERHNCVGCECPTEIAQYPERAILLSAGGKFEPRLRGGLYQGSDLGLLPDGHLIELRYRGEALKDRKFWSATVRVFASPLEAMNSRWCDVEQYVERLGAAFNRYENGEASKRAAKSEARADWLNAVALLLRGKS